MNNKSDSYSKLEKMNSIVGNNFENTENFSKKEQLPETNFFSVLIFCKG